MSRPAAIPLRGGGGGKGSRRRRVFLVRRDRTRGVKKWIARRTCRGRQRGSSGRLMFFWADRPCHSCPCPGPTAAPAAPSDFRAGSNFLGPSICTHDPWSWSSVAAHRRQGDMPACPATLAKKRARRQGGRAGHACSHWRASTYLPIKETFHSEAS